MENILIFLAKMSFIPNGYIMDLKIKSNSDKIITAIKGEILLFNTNNEQILSYAVEENLKLEAKQEMEGETFTIVFEDDNLTELKALPFSGIKQEWHPKLLIFSDGSRLDAPAKPLY